MAIKKEITYKKGGTTTTDHTTWTTIATVPMAANGVASILWRALGRDTTSGKLAHSYGSHQANRIAGTLALAENILILLTFTSGSDITLRLCTVRINISGDDIQLQVRGAGALTIEWYGKLEVLMN